MNFYEKKKERKEETLNEGKEGDGLTEKGRSGRGQRFTR